MKKILISITILLSCKTSLADMWEEAYNPLYYNYNENYIKENKEFTVVSIGDSYASGEGLPDKDVSLRKIGRAKCKAIKASDALDFITSGDTLTYLGEKTYDIPIKQALTISGDIWNGTNKVLGELIAFLTFQQTKPVGTSAKWVNNFAHRSLNNAPAIAIIKKLPKKIYLQNFLHLHILEQKLKEA